MNKHKFYFTAKKIFFSKKFAKAHILICQCGYVLSAIDRYLSGKGFFCPLCGILYISQVPHHELKILEKKTLLISIADPKTKGNLISTKESISAKLAPGDLRFYCPKCLCRLRVKRIWHDVFPSEDKARLVFGMLCGNKRCNYMNTIKFLGPLKINYKILPKHHTSSKNLFVRLISNNQTTYQKGKRYLAEIPAGYLWLYNQEYDCLTMELNKIYSYTIRNKHYLAFNLFYHDHPQANDFLKSQTPQRIHNFKNN